LNGGLYIALLNPSIGLVLAFAFLAFWLNQRWRHLVLLATGYAASAVGFLLQQFTPPTLFAATKLVSNVMFMAAMLCIASAIIDRHGRPLPTVAFGVLAAGGLAAWSWFMFVEPDLVWRIYVLNFALGGICLVMAAEMRVVPRRTIIEPLLLALSLLAGLNFFARALAAVPHDGSAVTYATLYSSVYWTTTMLSHAVFSIAIAMTLIGSTAFDVIAELRNESQTDPLSGLLNRRGFEEQGSRMLTDARRSGLPASLVICDLDHFKAVNDGFGHACGDRVIAAVGALFGTAASARHAAARIGGEEFAIVLPGANLPAARLFAEGIRNTLAALAIDGLPQRHALTASFGVAELAGPENLTELLARADAALYAAKKDGRDCVRVARPAAVWSPQRSAG
jgi:diguanylate cyclase (GGDEF)-like protein